MSASVPASSALDLSRENALLRTRAERAEAFLREQNTLLRDLRARIVSLHALVTMPPDRDAAEYRALVAYADKHLQACDDGVGCPECGALKDEDQPHAPDCLLGAIEKARR